VKCPECDCLLVVPEGSTEHVGTCSTCGKLFRATRFGHATQIELLDLDRPAAKAPRGARRKSVGPEPAGRDAAPAPVVWTLRVASLAMLAVLPCVAVTEGLARLRSDHALVASGETAVAKVYSPLTYPLAPEDTTGLTYVYEVDGEEFRGRIRNDLVHKEPSFQIRTQEVKISENGTAYVERPKELASLVGLVAVTYSPSDPGYHQIGAVTRQKSWSTEIRFLWGGVLAVVGAILAMYFFRVRPLSAADKA
jgi:hypothetical protein